jgi:hypothetical protein
MLEYMRKALNKKAFMNYSTLYSADYRSRIEFRWMQRRVSHFIPFHNGANLAINWYPLQDTLTRVEKIHGYRINSDPERVILENRNRIGRKTMDFLTVVGALKKWEKESGQMEHVIIRFTSLYFWLLF